MSRFIDFVKVFRNKYAISLVVFAIWIAFFDRNDLFTQWDRKKELQKLEESSAFYEKEIAATKKDLMDLNTTPAMLEKFAREKFFLKRPNEDIFLVSDSLVKKN